ncbi:transcriptional regulatory protein ZraR [Geobacter sp. OR-1]|uniref:sigma-54-dependent transcriptional regulator n=1 Tax=Geobacter sp. OR-1 TaxID=1266765 RepID=UPI0005444C61|nr:sigma-54 dependent transcriptional regulator [Geobacter sp. OR-1]GAM09864.1 transcriptional regulatory protein ZraR [Geobacter sp. OR-1]
MKTVFICDDEKDILNFLGKLLKVNSYRFETFDSATALLARLEADPAPECDAVLMDVRMPDLDGIQAMKRLKRRSPGIPVVVMTGHGTIDDAVHAIKLGAYDYITKPFPKEKLLGVLDRLFDHARLARENRELREELHLSAHTGPIVFRSAAFREVYDLTLQVAASDANILVTGESGTGKELIAAAVHNNSLRKGKQLVSVNCAALSDTLLESQLFGHMRGAFTGAVMNQKGLLEEADGGTLFLDEIGDVSPAIQAKLLRVIQQKEFIVVGSTKPRSVDVRFVAATNRDLMLEVKEGRFREDLYYRLNVIGIPLPPLRERLDDVEPLARHFLAIYSARMKKGVRSIAEDAIRLLLDYDWPGNVRELENVIERGVILARTDILTADLLPVGARKKDQAQNLAGQLIPLDEIERRHICSVLLETGFHKSRTAEILEISRKTLDRKIAEYNIADPGNK